MATWSGAWSMVRVQLDTLLLSGQRWASPHVTCSPPSVGVLSLVTWTNCQTARWVFLLSTVVFGFLSAGGQHVDKVYFSIKIIPRLCLCHLVLWAPSLHLPTVTRANIRSLETVARTPRLATWSGSGLSKVASPLLCCQLVHGVSLSVASWF